jgi:two-component sensor histidine kinase
MSDRGAQSEQGTGIGMMIMQAAARQLGGNLEIFRGGQGYHLEFSWPLGTH